MDDAPSLATPVPVPAYPAAGLMDRALDLLFPPTCVGCRRVGRWLCRRCWDTFPWEEEFHCVLCARSWPGVICPPCHGDPSALDSMAAVARFDGVAREAVHTLKYHGKFAIGRMMAPLMAARLEGVAGTLVAPVPLHPTRRRERGFDQSAVLARGIARALDLPYEEQALRRTRPTRQQALLDRAQRQQNVAGAFAGEMIVEGEDLILVDDVMTTGSTIGAAAAGAKAAGARTVTGLVFAHAGEQEPFSPA